MKSPHGRHFSNLNALWGTVFADTLAGLGAGRAVISPGSRSTPLAHALACEGRIRSTPVLDERTAAFFALGLARATHRPVVLVCTSGTAAANHLPAVVEAFHAQVPLLVVTADRPPGLRDCGAGQTIVQRGLYGVHVVWECEAPVPRASVRTLVRWREVLSAAWQRASGGLGTPPGPVHINVPLDEPLAPSVAQSGFAPRGEALWEAVWAFDKGGAWRRARGFHRWKSLNGRGGFREG